MGVIMRVGVVVVRMRLVDVMMVMRVGGTMQVSRGRGRVVRAGFGRERRQHGPHGRAESNQHMRNDGIFPDQDAMGLELRREVSVADVPGKPDERSRIRRRDLDELFWRGFHAHYLPILES